MHGLDNQEHYLHLQLPHFRTERSGCQDKRADKGLTAVYRYIGPSDLKALGQDVTQRVFIGGISDVLAWIDSKQSPQRDSVFVATFIVDCENKLWIADRHSEHVACARGGDVLSAGEIVFERYGQVVVVTDVSNQSTGYCPEPESWPAVAAALDKAGIRHPHGFTQKFIFRLCEGCGQTNVVKEGDFTCAVCGTELKQEWNFSHDKK